VEAPAQVHQRDDGGDACSYQRQPDGCAQPDQNAIGGSRTYRASPAPGSVVSIHDQQLVWGALLLFDDNTVPSLVVIEQLSLLSRKKLDASTEPTSDCEIGVTVIDHGM
jgi:gamma-glutamylcyclotransferase (GGCT)/AIG2-like uncharacterized protein YtfP